MSLRQPLDVPLPDGRAYQIHFSPLADAPSLMAGAGLRPGPCLVVTDSNVGPRYLGRLALALQASGWAPRARVLPAGEPSKSLDVLSALYDWALDASRTEMPLDRETPVLALGGGVVGDIAGFLAATLLRGLPLVQLPTTVIAQADSAVGGKTGINHRAGKNLIGAFHQPRLVISDASTMATLPAREWMSGLAEVVKSALIADDAFFAWVEDAWDRLAQREEDAAVEAVARAAAIKAAVVAEDEREAGRRAILNFGHTFGHAIERATGYGSFTHGEAVALGMRAALYLSYRLHPALERARADALVARIGVPTGLADVSTEALTDAMRHDKKHATGRQRFVLLDRIGSAYVAEDVPEAWVEAAWAFATGASRGMRKGM